MSGFSKVGYLRSNAMPLYMMYNRVSSIMWSLMLLGIKASLIFCGVCACVFKIDALRTECIDVAVEVVVVVVVVEVEVVVAVEVVEEVVVVVVVVEVEIVVVVVVVAVVVLVVVVVVVVVVVGSR